MDGNWKVVPLFWPAWDPIPLIAGVLNQAMLDLATGAGPEVVSFWIRDGAEMAVGLGYPRAKVEGFVTGASLRPIPILEDENAHKRCYRRTLWGIQRKYKRAVKDELQ